MKRPGEAVTRIPSNEIHEQRNGDGTPIMRGVPHKAQNWRCNHGMETN